MRLNASLAIFTLMIGRVYMNLFRTPTLLIVGLIILIAERIYYVNKNDSHINNAENVAPAIQDPAYAQYNEYNKNRQYNQNANVNRFAGDESEKYILHTPNSGLRFNANNNAGQQKGPEEKWQRYGEQMPDLFRYNNPAKKGVDYSEENIGHLQRLAYDGDILAKFLYGYHLSKQIIADAEKARGTNDPIFWNSRITEIRQLYIDSASHGLHSSAHELSRLYSLPQFRDIVESLSWAFIADAMREEGDKSLNMVCSEKNDSPCTDEMLMKGLDRAQNYVKTYSFKIEKQ